jgi:DNA-binding HxlR family transcriptional regulator
VGRTAARLKTQGSGLKTQSSGLRAQGSGLKDHSSAARAKDSRQQSTLALDRLIHERLRLGIVSALAVNDRLTFNELKILLKTTDGNLSVHARKLEDAEYLVCEKTFQGRVPRSEYRLTANGRRALEKYLVHMEALIRAVKENG